MKKRLRVGILDFLTNTPNETWFQSHVMLPNYSSIMPQCIAVWAEELGHEVFYQTYTSREELLTCLPQDLDVLFVSCFSRSSFLAYSVSMEYRRRGTVTVLGGPHARSFVQHSRHYFDYLCQLTDKALIKALLEAPERHEPAVVLSAKAQPTELPGARARGKFIDLNVKKGWSQFRTIPLVGSLGCPYTCSFCIDAPVPYRPLPYEQIVDDLRYIEHAYGKAGGKTFVIWHDPNFGIRFKDYMGVLEESGTKLMHLGETTLSLLNEDNLKALKRNNFIGVLPGIESWYGYNNKGAQKRNYGMDKVRSAAEHINLVLAYLPYVQANFVIGLDDDAGDEPWDCTREFVRQAPGAFPGFSLVTDFQNSPMSEELHRQGRTLLMPYQFLDNNFATNVKLKNYSPHDFYARMVRMFEDVWSYKTLYRRVEDNAHWLIKLINFGRGMTEGRGRFLHHRFIREKLATESEFAAFFSGRSELPPRFYFDVLRQQLGRYANLLPVELTTPAGFVESVRSTAPEIRAIPAEKTAVAAVA